MNDDTTIENPTIELSNDDLACAHGGLPVDPNGDPGGPTGRPVGPWNGLQIPPGKIPVFSDPPHATESGKKLPGEQTPPIFPFPTA